MWTFLGPVYDFEGLAAGTWQHASGKARGGTTCGFLTWTVSQQPKLPKTYHSTQIIAIFGQARRQELLDVGLDATDAGECPQEVPWDLSCSKSVEQAP